MSVLLTVALAAVLSRGDRWFAHVQYLASDRLEGRATGTRGYERAVEYVRRQFRAAGLDTRLQPVPYVIRRTHVEASRVAVGDRELVVGRDVVFRLRASGDATKEVDAVEGDPRIKVIRSTAEDWPIELSDAALSNAVPADAKLRDPEQPLTIIVSPDASGALEKGARIQARHVIRTRHLTVPNVIGILRGTDPNEAVVVSAHLDHLGVALPVNGDAIYNGALDNASGVASLIEIARELSDRKETSRRSIVFLAPGAEEDGSYGSWYFVHHPVPDGVRIVADVNIDGNSAFYPFRSLMAVGTESLRAEVAAVADQRRVKVLPDPAPQRNTVAGSDQYSFIRAGIPALLVRRMAPDAEGRKLIVGIMAKAYHEPGDDLRLPWKPETAPDFDDFVAALVLRVANREK